MKSECPDGQSKIPIIKERMASRVEVVIVAVFLIVSFLHLLRLLTGAEILIAGHVIPVWTSIIGFAGPLLLVCLFWWSKR